MKLLTSISTILLVCTLALPQEPTDPAFGPPAFPSGDSGGKVRWNGTIGMVVINGKVYQQFGLRPDIPFGRFGVGLDLTVRYDPDGNFKDDEWDESKDYIDKLYYLRYGQPGDPFYLRLGALDNVTLGYGMVMKRYSNTMQYPEVKRIGLYSEGEVKRVSWQAMLNNFKELDQPGLLAGRLAFNTGLAGLTVGGTVAHDGNMFAGIQDFDKDGVPDRLDLFPEANDFRLQRDLRDRFRNDPELLNYLIDNGFLPDIRDSLITYRGLRESATALGVDAGIPLHKGRPVSIWGYGQVAKMVDFGWGWAFPGLRMVIGTVELGAEYRQYEKQFRGQFFDLTYEIERVKLVDSRFITKEKSLEHLGRARGYYADALVSVANLGYVFSWYEDMRGENFETGKTLYAEAGITPPQVSRLQKVAGYYLQPSVKTLFTKQTEGTMYGAKLFFMLAPKVSLVYDHRITYFDGRTHRTVRIETMISF